MLSTSLTPWCPLSPVLSGRDHLSREELKFVLGAILDGSRFREFKATYGKNVITGFGKLNGSVIVVAARSGALITDG